MRTPAPVPEPDPPHPDPWVRRESRAIYANPWISVREDAVLRPDGRPGIYGVVEFRNQATGIVAIDEQGRTPLVGQWRYPLGAWSWEIPEGGAPRDEDPLDAARRELAEETGLRADTWEPLLVSHLSNCVTDEIAYIYLARDLVHGTARPDDDERLEVVWVPLDEAVRRVRTGEITDAVSQLGLLLAAARLGRVEDHP